MTELASDRRAPETSVVIAESDWTKKYKRALLERNPMLQMWCIEVARKAMAIRASELAETSNERHAIDRAFFILEVICEERSARDH